MPVPKRKTSKSRKNKRSAGKKAIVLNFSKCPTCSAPAQAHAVCKECGHYKGVKVLRTKTDRLYERNKVRQAASEANSSKEVQEVSAESKEK
ncbi:50S ribosomal protein L32 [Candidatus Dependentiae bacterium]|nr:50S ribosomal protein L32 [Candidatus Dependentiae bacterium]